MPRPSIRFTWQGRNLVGAAQISKATGISVTRVKWFSRHGVLNAQTMECAVARNILCHAICLAAVELDISRVAVRLRMHRKTLNIAIYVARVRASMSKDCHGQEQQAAVA